MSHNFDWSEKDRRTLFIFDNHVSGSFCPCYYHGKQNEKYQGIGHNESCGTVTVKSFNLKDHKRSLEWLCETVCISWWCSMFQLLLHCYCFSCDLPLSLLRNALCESHLWHTLVNHLLGTFGRRIMVFIFENSSCNVCPSNKSCLYWAEQYWWKFMYNRDQEGFWNWYWILIGWPIKWLYLARKLKKTCKRLVCVTFVPLFKYSMILKRFIWLISQSGIPRASTQTQTVPYFRPIRHHNLFQSNKTGFSPNDPITEQPTSGALPGVNDIVGQVGADMANKAVDDFISDFKK